MSIMDTSGKEEYMIFLKFNKNLIKKIRKLTSSDSSLVFIWMDDEKIALEKNTETITNGEITIGDFSYNEAKNIANTVLSGELPISLFVKKCSEVTA